MTNDRDNIFEGKWGTVSTGLQVFNKNKTLDLTKDGNVSALITSLWISSSSAGLSAPSMNIWTTNSVISNTTNGANGFDDEHRLKTERAYDRWIKPAMILRKNKDYFCQTSWNVWLKLLLPKMFLYLRCKKKRLQLDLPPLFMMKSSLVNDDTSWAIVSRVTQSTQSSQISISSKNIHPWTKILNIFSLQ